jgi:capsule polysaccharide export protein KpsE/RkpR
MYDALKLDLDSVTAELETARLSINENCTATATLKQEFERTADELRVRTMERDQARSESQASAGDMQRLGTELILARQERDAAVSALERVLMICSSYLPVTYCSLLVVAVCALPSQRPFPKIPTALI